MVAIHVIVMYGIFFDDKYFKTINLWHKQGEILSYGQDFLMYIPKTQLIESA